MVDTQFQTKMKIIRSDNALDLGKSIEATNLFLFKGTIHQTSCNSTPQQNGVVERKHKHLLETSRALSFQSNLPFQFWGDCVLIATYLINRFPTKTLHGKTPFQHTTFISSLENLWMSLFCIYPSQRKRQISVKSLTICVCWVPFWQESLQIVQP